MALHIKNINGSPCFVTMPNIYKYHGIIFEFHRYCGPIRCNKNLEVSKVGMGRKFFKVFDKWNKLTPSKKKRTLIYS